MDVSHQQVVQTAQRQRKFTFAFKKMHGLKNDFILIDCRLFSPDLVEAICAQARVICDRRIGIGADQILLLKEPQRYLDCSVRMEILNQDGSFAEMCGNGIRAVAVYLKEQEKQGLLERRLYLVETVVGDPKRVEIFEDETVEVNMGVPTCLGREFHFTDPQYPDLVYYEVGMGNPHAVFFVPRGQGAWLRKELGSRIENDLKAFPDRTNVEFVEETDSPSQLKVYVWERGAGITPACGSGACAVAVVRCQVKQKFGEPIHIIFPWDEGSGTLQVRWAGGAEPVYMRGPAKEVYSGVYSIMHKVV